jgi:hypothetical protein
VTTCVLCSASFEAHTSYGLCPACWQRDRLREFDRLESAKKFARLANLPVSLTLIEWLAILSDFQGHCAYCQLGHYSIIEMVDRTKGLVRDNVVPACRSCDVYVRTSWSSACERVAAYVECRGTQPFLFVPDAEESEILM